MLPFGMEYQSRGSQPLTTRTRSNDGRLVNLELVPASLINRLLSDWDHQLQLHMLGLAFQFGTDIHLLANLACIKCFIRNGL